MAAHRKTVERKKETWCDGNKISEADGDHRGVPSPHIARNFVARAAEVQKVRARRAKLIGDWGQPLISGIETLLMLLRR